MGMGGTSAEIQEHLIKTMGKDWYTTDGMVMRLFPGALASDGMSILGMGEHYKLEQAVSKLVEEGTLEKRIRGH